MIEHTEIVWGFCEVMIGIAESLKGFEEAMIGIAKSLREFESMVMIGTAENLWDFAGL